MEQGSCNSSSPEEQDSSGCAGRVGQAVSNVLSRFLPDPKAKKEPETTQLSYYTINGCRPRGICLLINNVPNLVSEAEEQLTGLFKNLFFDVQVRRSLQMLQIYEVAQEFAKKDHSEFDSFIVIIMSVCQDNDISGVDGRKASLEQVMCEFKAKNCPSLKGKPKLFLVQGVTLMRPSNVAPCCTDTEMDVRPVCLLATTDGDNCPEEADFLLTCVTTAVDKVKPVPKTLFIKVLIKVIKTFCHSHHLIKMLTKVNKWMANKQSGDPNRAVQVPYLTHTLRAKVHLGPVQDTGSLTQDVAQRNRYKLDKRRRGYCVIINNLKFKEKAMNRPGAEEDERNLKQLFKDLFFKVIVERNLTKHQMERVAVKYGAIDHSKFDAFVMIVMSHGVDRDCILGVDGRDTPVKNLMVEFQELKCPSLKKKPKVFIIQTCRGSLDEVCLMSTSPAGKVSLQAGTSTSAAVDNEPCDASPSSESTLPRSVFPREFDFVLAFATVPGYVSFRSKVHGTFFIQTMVEVIREHHHSHDFLDILTEVTKQVVERQSHKDHPVQVPAPTHTMTKLLYL